MASGRDAELEFQKRLTNLFGEGSVHRNKKDERRRERDFVVNKNGKECFIELKSAMIQPGSSDAIIHLTQHEIDLAKDCAEMSAPNKCYWLVIWTRDQNGSRQYAYWDSKPLRTHECAEKWEEWRFVTERQELGSSWDAACDSKTAKENLLKSTRAGNRRVVVKCKLSKMGAPLDDADLMKPIEEFIYGQRQPQSMNA